jgi:exonuclease VII small subunit
MAQEERIKELECLVEKLEREKRQGWNALNKLQRLLAQAGLTKEMLYDRANRQADFELNGVG